MDIRLLANHFLMEYTKSEGRDLRFSPDSMELMESYEWPSNVRELKGVVDYAATMVIDSLLTPDALPNFLYTGNRAPRKIKSSQNELPYFVGVESGILLSTVLRHVERILLRRYLKGPQRR